MTTKNDLRVFDKLAVVVIDGFEPEDTTIQLEDGTVLPGTDAWINLPGSANWLVEQYGMAPGNFTAGPGEHGIFWTDYDMGMDGDGWRFSVLMDAGEVDDLREFAEQAGYTIARVETVDEPMHYGDGGRTATICKHPDGWIIFT